MRNVNIPVTTFCKKIILTENAYTQPIQYDRSNEQLFIYLSCLQAKAQKSRDIVGTLTDVLVVHCHDQLAKQIAQNPLGAGWILNRMYRQKLNEYIYVRTESGAGILQSINEFAYMYGVELDIDIAVDTLTRSWRRYKTLKKTTIIANKMAYAVRSDLRKPTFVLPYTDAELDDICKKYKSQNKGLFMRPNGREYQKRYTQLTCYVYRIIGQRQGKYLANKFKITDSAVCRHVESFSNLLKFARPIEV
jgi:hypothetical protein